MALLDFDVHHGECSLSGCIQHSGLLPTGMLAAEDPRITLVYIGQGAACELKPLHSIGRYAAEHPSSAAIDPHRA